MTFSLTSPNELKTARLSECGTYRYELRREWSSAPLACFVMLNPSTADANVDDRTIRRCVGFARSWGNGGIVVVNLFALRSKHPSELARHADPVGPKNDDFIRSALALRWVTVVCAWGADPLVASRSPRVLSLIREAGHKPQCLRLTEATRAPEHPLYLPASLRPIPFPT